MSADARITSRRHPLVARLRAAARREGPDVLLDGPHLLAEALRHDTAAPDGPCTLHLVVVTHSALARPDIEALCDDATARGLEVHLVPDALADAISPTRTPSGVVALASVPLRPLEAVLATHDASGRAAFVLILAGVQDPGNVGTIIRAAEAGGVTGVVLLEHTADPLGWKALRGSMGSALRVPLHRADDDARVLATLATAGLTLVAAESGPGTPATTPDVSAPLALAVGAEGRGLPQALIHAADASGRIPVAPAVESLNVAIAAALLVFEIRRRRGGPGVLP